jgi:hypothetical protein
MSSRLHPGLWIAFFLPKYDIVNLFPPNWPFNKHTWLSKVFFGINYFRSIISLQGSLMMTIVVILIFLNFKFGQSLLLLGSNFITLFELQEISISHDYVFYDVDPLVLSDSVSHTLVRVFFLKSKILVEIRSCTHSLSKSFLILRIVGYKRGVKIKSFHEFLHR